MPEPSGETTLYRLVLQPIGPLRGENLHKCARSLSTLQGFKRHARSDERDELEYRYTEKGRTKCRFQITNDGVAAETSRKGVSREEWDRWMIEMLQNLGSDAGMNWRGNDLAVLAVVHQHRFEQPGNNYEFLRDALFQGSPMHQLVGDLRLTDLDVTVRAIPEADVELLIRVTSNQPREDILDGALDDEDNRLLFEFHSLRRDINTTRELLDLAQEQENKLEDWLKSAKILESIRGIATT